MPRCFFLGRCHVSASCVSKGEFCDSFLKSFWWLSLMQRSAATVRKCLVREFGLTPPPHAHSVCMEGKRHINIHFWFGGWLRDEWLVHRTKELCVLLAEQTYKLSLLVNRSVVPRLTAFSKWLCSSEQLSPEYGPEVWKYHTQTEDAPNWHLWGGGPGQKSIWLSCA